MPVFDGLLPSPHNRIVQDLLFELATWHALAKLRLHLESTLQSLGCATTRLGRILRQFEATTCNAFVTRELPSEEAARGRHKAAAVMKEKSTKAPSNANANPTNARQKSSLADPEKPKKQGKKRTFNLATYKNHSLGDYEHYIRKYGTTDGFTTQIVS
jgi:hypothetical protein